MIFLECFLYPVRKANSLWVQVTHVQFVVKKLLLNFKNNFCNIDKWDIPPFIFQGPKTPHTRVARYDTSRIAAIQSIELENTGKL